MIKKRYQLLGIKIFKTLRKYGHANKKVKRSRDIFMSKKPVAYWSMYLNYDIVVKEFDFQSFY